VKRRAKYDKNWIPAPPQADKLRGNDKIKNNPASLKSETSQGYARIAKNYKPW
jgi:hypothetical protein